MGRFLVWGGAVIFAVACGDSDERGPGSVGGGSDASTSDASGSGDGSSSNDPDGNRGTDASTTADASTTDDASQPTHQGGIGSACTEDMDCFNVGQGTCYTTLQSGFVSYTLPGGYCTKMCNANASTDECGTGATCVGMGSDAACVKTCGTNADCREDDGYGCQDLPLAGKVCLPPISLNDGGIGFPDAGF